MKEGKYKGTLIVFLNSQGVPYMLRQMHYIKDVWPKEICKLARLKRLDQDYNKECVKKLIESVNSPTLFQVVNFYHNVSQKKKGGLNCETRDNFKKGAILS